MDTLKLENQLCFPLYAAAREVMKKYTPLLKDLKLTYTQYITMMVLWAEQRIGVKQLGERLYLDSGTLTPLLKRLEKQGYITRERDSADERNLIITISDAGNALKARAAGIQEQMAQCLSLSADDAQALYAILYKILEKS